MSKLPAGPVEDLKGALHLEAIDVSLRNGRAQGVSAGFHAALLVVLVFAITSASRTQNLRRLTPVGGNKLFPYIPHLPFSGTPSRGSEGSGGGRDRQAARSGNLVPFSSIPLVPPRLSHNQQPVLPAPPAVFDPNAPASVPVVTNLGLPWMTADADSAGRGKGQGFGEGGSDTMGDGSGDRAGGGGDHGRYANVVSPVTCVYCPQPGYTEEARKAKLQGKLLLQALVGEDGRAVRVQVLQGLGMGLDEAAVAAVQRWRFTPARDAGKRSVSSWVTVETRFQLF